MISSTLALISGSMVDEAISDQIDSRQVEFKPTKWLSSYVVPNYNLQPRRQQWLRRSKNRRRFLAANLRRFTLFSMVNPGLYSLIVFLFLIPTSIIIINYKLKKRRWCACDSNSGRRIVGADETTELQRRQIFVRQSINYYRTSHT